MGMTARVRSRSGSSSRGVDRRMTNAPLQMKQMTTLTSNTSNVFLKDNLSNTHSQKTLHGGAKQQSISTAIQNTQASSKANQPYQSI